MSDLYSSRTPRLTVNTQSLLQRSVDKMMRKATMQQAIDEMYTKDQLKDAFTQLTLGAS